LIKHYELKQFLFIFLYFYLYTAMHYHKDMQIKTINNEEKCFTHSLKEETIADTFRKLLTIINEIINENFA